MALFLTRRPFESIIIGDDIKITVVSTDRNRTKLAIDAPRSTEVHREEVYNKTANKGGVDCD